MEVKTNVMRILDKAKIEYTPHFYDGEIVDGVGIAEALGEDVNCTFKTLVTVSDKGEHFVFVVPVAENLDIKKYFDNLIRLPERILFLNLVLSVASQRFFHCLFHCQAIDNLQVSFHIQANLFHLTFQLH